MKRKIARTGLGIIFAIGLGVSMATPAQAGGPPCSLARAAGNWAFTDSGTVLGVGPRDAVGIFTLDAAGNLLNGVATSSLNGTIADETFFGTYTVNSNCTGSISIEIFESGNEILTVTLNLAFDDKMEEMRGLFTSVVVPNGPSLQTVIALDARKQ
jgi:hypothetical protein